MKKLTVILIICFLAGNFCFIASSQADEGKKSSLKGIEVLGGYAQGNVHEEKHYKLVPLFVDFDFDLKPLFAKNYPGMLQFVEEPFFAYAFSPHKNIEVGNNFLIKFGLVPETWKLQPYLKAGVGIVYMTEHTRQQGTQFNFNEYIGFGIHYFIRNNFALTGEYRYRHLSNADTASPNRGIETWYGLVGISYLF